MRFWPKTLLPLVVIAAASAMHAGNKGELAPELFAPGIISTQLDESSGRGRSCHRQ
jgi:hypothetical protein